MECDGWKGWILNEIQQCVVADFRKFFFVDAILYDEAI